jgi:hypothetical protein
MPTDRKKLDEMEQRANSAFGQQDREAILEALHNMEDGEFFIYSHTYQQRLIVREEEMPLVIAYQGELHIAETDLAQDMHNILERIQDLLNDPKSMDDTHAALFAIAQIMHKGGYEMRGMTERWLPSLSDVPTDRRE